MNMIKKCASLLLCLLMLLSLLPQTFAAQTETVPEGYTAIATPEDLWLIRNDMAGNYILTADIDLTEALAEGGSLYNADSAWIPLGYDSSSSTDFTGILDGNGHKIYGLKCTGARGGLIDSNYGTIKNITIASGEISATTEISGTICAANWGTISNCKNYATVSAGGGICGINWFGTIEFCYNAGRVCDGGGIALEALGGVIRYVWNSGEIGSDDSLYAGGIAWESALSLTIENAYNTGTVHGAYAGGISGCMQSDAYFINCYNVGNVTGMTAAGSLLGQNKDSSTCKFTSCYYLNTMSKAVGEGTYSGNDPVALSDAMMQRQAAFSGFDFDTVWTMGTCSYKYPVLQGFDVHTLEHVSAKAATCTADGNIEHWYCSVCQGYFTDSEATQATTAEAVKLPGTHQYSATITAPTCTTTGYTTYTCSICSDSYNDNETAALGHNYINGKCEKCGSISVDIIETVNFSDLKDGDVIAIVMHTAENMTNKEFVLLNNFGSTPLNNAAEFDGTFSDIMYWTVKIVDGQVYLYSGENGLYVINNNNGLRVDGGTAAAITMSTDGYLSLNDSDGSTRYIGVYDNNLGDMSAVSRVNFRCYKNTTTNTKNQTTTLYLLSEGSKPSAPEYRLDENLSFSMSISAGAEMTVSYNFLASAVNSYADFYLEITKDVAGGDPITTIYGITEDREALTAKVNPSTGEALMYQVTYKGINAKEMGDNFSTTLYAVGEDGTIYYGNTTISSIKDYLVNKIDDTRSIPELKTMAVDMLKYGAAAQVRLGYNTENLVTADLIEEQLAYATQEIPEAVNNAASTGDGASVNTNITVTSKVQLNLSCIYTTATDPNAVKCIVTDSEGNVLAEIPATNKNNLMFTAIYENVGAKEMRDVINATFYEGETAISQTVSWSVESYVAQVRAKTTAAENEIAMVNAMLTYGDAVAAYMEAK